MKSKAVSYGAATVVNAIASGMGAAFGVGLETEAIVELTASGIECSIPDHPGEDTRLMEYCVSNVFDFFGVDYGANVETKSNIPPARGLKSSSAAANAVVLAAVDAVLSEDPALDTPSDMEIINMGVDAALKAEVSITGALDDAAASYFGGYVVTDNLGRSIVKREPMDEALVLFFVPEKKTYTLDVDAGRARSFKRESRMIWDEALRGNIYSALTLNGLLYSAIFGQDPSVAVAAIEAGALAAGLCGTGPSVAAVVRDPAPVADAWGGLGGDIISSRVNNIKAHVK